MAPNPGMFRIFGSEPKPRSTPSMTLPSGLTPDAFKGLARISHTFFQNKREAADFLSLPYFGEKQCVCSAGSAALHGPALRLKHAQTNYWL